MNILGWVCIVFACLVAERRAGWLDRIVSFHRKIFLNDFEQTIPKIQGRLVREPPPQDEDKVWDYASVQRLLALLAANEDAAPLRRALGRALSNTPSRRRGSYQSFSKQEKHHPNNFYYDFAAEEADDKGLEAIPFDASDDAILVLDNPVEAMLPSAKISVRLLKDILESRALAARGIRLTKKPTTTPEATTVAGDLQPNVTLQSNTTSNTTTPGSNSTVTDSAGLDSNATTGGGNITDTTVAAP